MEEKTKEVKSSRNEFDLTDESDRGAAIVGAALLEDALVTMLKERMSLDKMSQKQVKDIFDLSGPLSNFSSKISIAFAFGFIDKLTFNDLQIVRKIRNKFAHSMDGLSFDDEEVKSQVHNMYCFRYAKEKFPHRYSPSTGVVLNEGQMRASGFIRLNKAAFSIAVQHLSMRVIYSSMFRNMKESGVALPEKFLEFKDIYDA